MEDTLMKARIAAEHKLNQIIETYGDAGGERRKPYYFEKLVEEAKEAIYWQEFSLALMGLDAKKAPTIPTKVSSEA